MKRHQFLYVISIVSSSLLLFLSGCAATSPPPTQSDTSMAVINTITASPVPSTPPLLPPTQTPSLTPSLMPTSDAILVPTVQPVAMETPAAIPTPPNDEIKQQVLWLFETNNGCQLPCWWGITPGQTKWSTAEEFLHRFDRDIYSSSSTPGLVYYGVTIPLPTEVFAEDRAELGISVRNGIVEFIDTRVSMGNTPSRYLTQFTLSPFLTIYGQPAEIWLSTYSSPFEHNDLPFRVVLFYPNQGIAALYSDNGIRRGDVVRGCPQQGPASFLSLWHAALDLSFEEVKSGAAVFSEDFLSLEESTTIDVSTFYETFKRPDNTTCLETPADLWR